ncbi:SAM-dependent methyltransferase [Poseidonibacter ostreae]|uniref:SAM-dependent methyltransferase n=1 Tax=Poseidonibacter ostreae TaxID=2654171 RepID=A0A6L4WRU6_9BACT|nr:SAM-dependent methyltransferase [Poseidonibacter ostreae]KAB7884297.1 SAM-dependent methyltransferase [Poseidonibacter ostreae]KAB7885280.1 SAM-dependent methyltransferase [Poseidonibacter ostreae]KAB7891964.1 SAM-dependent methyltransferase [Poseidonibacter ostreae]
MNKSKELDQFYTNNKIAESCMDELNKNYKLDNYFLLEPSAGTGSFSDLFHKNSLAIDIDPKKPYMKKIDFLGLSINAFNHKNVFTIGNPPFGKNSSLAIKFFNKSAEFSDYIAFVVPKTFKKASLTNKLSLDFHLDMEKDIPLDSFIFEGKKYSVPCVFQVWKKMDVKREPIYTKSSTELFEFTTKEDADFAIRRVGGLAGKVLEEFAEYSESSNYFIKTKRSKRLLTKKIRSVYEDLNILAKNSAGNPSLSKHELITTLERSN